uniref:Putative RNA binding domain protein n=1 Tax=viral metagenome TaxID=1070528 RepID=A0A6M3KZG1_9ZZZZ
MKEIEMVPVDSSMIKAYGYDRNTGRLRVTFNNDKTYEYYGIPQLVFKAFEQADSKGSFFHRNIKKQHEGKLM